MRRVSWAIVAAVALLLAFVFRHDLQPAYRGPAGARPLAREPVLAAPVRFGMVLGSLGSGLITLEPPPNGLVIHYWATWNRESGPELAALDSLVRTAAPGPRVVAVTADPMPSVARYARRRRLALEILLDPGGELRAVAPLKAIPSTYVFDGQGRLVARHDGPVDWWAPETREILREAATRGTKAGQAQPAS